MLRSRKDVRDAECNEAKNHVIKRFDLMPFGQVEGGALGITLWLQGGDRTLRFFDTDCIRGNLHTNDRGR